MSNKDEQDQLLGWRVPDVTVEELTVVAALGHRVQDTLNVPEIDDLTAVRMATLLGCALLYGGIKVAEQTGEGIVEKVE